MENKSEKTNKNCAIMETALQKMAILIDTRSYANNKKGTHDLSDLANILVKNYQFPTHHIYILVLSEKYEEENNDISNNSFEKDFKRSTFEITKMFDFFQAIINKLYKGMFYNTLVIFYYIGNGFEYMNPYFNVKSSELINEGEFTNQGKIVIHDSIYDLFISRLPPTCVFYAFMHTNEEDCPFYFPYKWSEKNQKWKVSKFQNPSQSLMRCAYIFLMEQKIETKIIYEIFFKNNCKYFSEIFDFPEKALNHMNKELKTINNLNSKIKLLAIESE